MKGSGLVFGIVANLVQLWHDGAMCSLKCHILLYLTSSQMKQHIVCRVEEEEAMQTKSPSFYNVSKAPIMKSIVVMHSSPGNKM